MNTSAPSEPVVAKQCLRCSSHFICLPCCGDIFFVDQLGVEERDGVQSTCILHFDPAALLYTYIYLGHYPVGRITNFSSVNN